MCTDPNNTSYSLLERALNLDDSAAWDSLYERYMTFVYHVLVKVGIKESDRDDLCQSVFIELSSKLKNYDLEKGKFRSWLATVVRNKALQGIRKNANYTKYVEKASNEPDAVYLLEGEYYDEFVEREWDNYLISLATDRIATSHTGKAAEIFSLGLEGKSSTEIAKLTGLQINSVYTIRQRIKQTLLKEADAIRAELEA